MLHQFIGNMRRWSVRARVTGGGPRVCLDAFTPQGERRRSVGDSFTADQAEQIGMALIQAAAIARAQHAHQYPEKRSA